jgi:hypothetical protein
MPRRPKNGPMRFGGGPMAMMERCRMMMDQQPADSRPNLATDELEALFFDWLSQVLDELQTIRDDPATITVADIEDRIGVSAESAEWLHRQLQQGER